MPKLEKERIVDEIAEQLQQAQGIYLTDFTGLSVAEITELRSNFRNAGVEFRVVKNSLTRLSAQKAGMDNLIDYLVGPTALALGTDEPIAPARIVKDFAKKLDKPTIKVGVIEGEIVSPEEVESIINIPPREVLLGQVVATFSAPMSSLVSVLTNLLGSLVSTLEAVKAKKEKESE